MAREKRTLPTKRQIRDFWAAKLVELDKFDSIEEATEADYCFACGFQFNTQRAHIEARVGDSTKDCIENIHLLCGICHTDSEALSGDDYWDWFRKRTIWDRTISSMMHAGFTYNEVQAVMTGDEKVCRELLARIKKREQGRKLGPKPS